MRHRTTAKKTFLNCTAFLVVGAATAVAATELRALNLSLLDAAKRGEWERVSSELLNDASVSARDRFGNTALIYAARGGHVKTARILIEAGADANQVNLNGNTPLFEAAGSGDIDLVGFLLHVGADPNLVNMKQVSPLSSAIYHKHAAVVELLLQSGARADFVDSTGKTGAVYAAANGDLQILTQLLDANNGPAISVDARYSHELTLLMWAAGYGHADVVKMLTARGAAVDLVDDRGKSALIMAAEQGHSAVVSHLLDQDCNINLRDSNGHTAKSLALLGGHVETARVLEKHSQ